MGRDMVDLPRSVLLIVLLLSPALAGCGGNGTPRATDSGEASPSEASPRTSDEEEITRLAHEFMEALSARNAPRLDELLAPQAALFSIREGEEGPAYSVRSRADFLEGIASGQTEFLERIWDPVVEVSGRIGMVWAPYDFHTDGALNHCGIDVLAFLKMAEGWKVTSITYNVVQEGCPESPLEPPVG